MSLIKTLDGPVLRLTIDRPDRSNAFDDALIGELTAAYKSAATDTAVRVVVLGASGKYFSAGGDLNWMQRMAGYSEAENVADAWGLASLMQAIDRCPKPTLARVQGSAFAGAVGLIACSDIVVAVPEAQFAITEVRIGLIPAVIGPYVVRTIGIRQARRWCLTAERFTAEEARDMGLVHILAPEDELDAAIAGQVDALLKAGPKALAAAKALLAEVDRPLDDDISRHTAKTIARIRAGAEGREGVTSFLEKRKPSWLGGGE